MGKCKVHKLFSSPPVSTGILADAQSAGKYQLQVFPEAGHFIQEDQPAKTAQILADFYKRNDRSALVLPPKVTEMQASTAMKKGPGGLTLGKGDAKK